MPVQAIYIPVGADVPFLTIMSQPISIFNWNIKFSVQPYPLPSPLGTPLILKTTANGGIVITQAGGLIPGEFLVLLNSSDTANMPEGDYSYDIWRTDLGSEYAIIPYSPFVLTNFPSSP